MSPPPCTAPKSYLFVRRQEWVPPAVASRFHGVIVCTRSERGRANRSVTWYDAVRAGGTEIITWEWMLPPGRWRPGLAGEADFAKQIGARAMLLNIEPASGSAKGTAADWRGQRQEIEAYTEHARDLCDRRNLELWGTSWALPTAAPSFPWLEFLRPCHVAIPQPYGVHGRTDRAYAEQSIAEYRERGAKSVIVGRGAHELDRSDDDAWRTSKQIAAHRATTPPGYDVAWWVPAGALPGPVLDAMLG